MNKPFLSLIIPAYNEAERLPATLEKIVEFLHSQSYTYELIVVENGSEDKTLQIARDYEKQWPFIRVLHETKRGKGNAVRMGMLIARGEYRFMADADLSMPVDEINQFLPPRIQNFDIAIGSREAPGSIRYKEPIYRHIGGRAINFIVRIMVLPGLHDTQCGFKCFHAGIAEDLFRNQTMAGWSFDIELLYIARLRGYRIVEVPINWYFNSESKVNAMRDALRMTSDIMQIRSNARRGMYNFVPNRLASASKPEH